VAMPPGKRDHMPQRDGMDDRRQYRASWIPGRLQPSKAKRQQMIEAARTLRGSQTDSEQILWEALRNGRLNGAKFRRQHPIGPLVVDFYCAKERLIIEVDGPVHEGQVERDHTREQLLKRRGHRVVRVRAEDVEGALPVVLQRIAEALRSSPQLLPSPEVRERGRG
jgi:very-short-patch-repair endonuclease